MASLFKKDIKYLKGVGEKRTKLFNKLGVFSIGTLLLFYPRTYEDWSTAVPIISAPIDTPCCIRAYVISPISKAIIKKNMTIYKLRISDGITAINVTFFNNPYITNSLKQDNEYLFYGRISYQNGQKVMICPQFDSILKGTAIHPIYSQTAGLTSKQISVCVKNALSLLPEHVNDPLPIYIRQKYNLIPLKDAIENIHFPKNQTSLQSAQRRLIFEELFTFQLSLALLKSQRKSQTNIKITDNFTDEFTNLLPFPFTNAQKKAVDQCISDMINSNFPMCRLIQGDVGSGKTAVAAAIAYTIIKNNFQVAFMAPTEILAQQHYYWFEKVLSSTDIKISLLTGSTKSSYKSSIKEGLKSGEVNLVIGTHALISDDVVFNNLGLVITDEQHRFGISHRSSLACKGNNPHILVMSATPIPRTLALIIYGDLDISILDELPPGRQKIDTYHIDSSKRTRMFKFIKNLVLEGHQGYIVCPLAEESESNLASAEQYSIELKEKHLKGLNIEFIHGKLRSSKKEKIMQNFSNGYIDILVSTTVIEVGVDIPNSSFIVIENAERFGLSQLHQLRGRVGRGEHKSYCILISDAQNEEALRRLNIMTLTNNGFKIADEDLKLRGPGDFFGSKQHGLPEFKIANISKDMKVLIETQDAVKDILRNDPSLELPENKLLGKLISAKIKNSKNTLN